MPKGQVAPDPGFSQRTKDRNPRHQNYHIEVQFHGPRVAVANAIEQYMALLQLALTAPTAAAPAPGFSPAPPPPLPPAVLQQLWPRAYKHFEECTSPARGAQALRGALQSPDRNAAARALVNVLVNTWKVRPKGGAARDLIFEPRGAAVNDIDANAPPTHPHIAQHGGPDQWLDALRADLAARFACLCSAVKWRRDTAQGRGIGNFHVAVAGHQFEVDVVLDTVDAPAMYAHADSDFTCNNFWITEESHQKGLQQVVALPAQPTGPTRQQQTIKL